MARVALAVEGEELDQGDKALGGIGHGPILPENAQRFSFMPRWVASKPSLS